LEELEKFKAHVVACAAKTEKAEKWLAW
jgi:hypothetical protein